MLRKCRRLANETVYSLGADATNELAVQKSLKLNNRPLNHL